MLRIAFGSQHENRDNPGIMGKELKRCIFHLSCRIIYGNPGSLPRCNVKTVDWLFREKMHLPSQLSNNLWQSWQPARLQCQDRRLAEMLRCLTSRSAQNRVA